MLIVICMTDMFLSFSFLINSVSWKEILDICSSPPPPFPSLKNRIKFKPSEDVNRRKMEWIQLGVLGFARSSMKGRQGNLNVEGREGKEVQEAFRKVEYPNLNERVKSSREP